MKKLRLLVILMIVLLVPPLGTTSGEVSYKVFLPAMAREYKAPKRDDFNGPLLDPMWSWIAEDPPNWSVTDRPGFLRIVCHPGGPDNRNFLWTAAPEGDYEVTTRVLFTPTANFQKAGLVLYMADSTFVSLGRAFCNLDPPLCVGNGIYFDRVEQGTFLGGNFVTATTNPSEAYLRVRREGNAYSAFYSEDGTTWTFMGTHTPSPGVDLSKLGVTSWALMDDLYVEADFDFVEIRTGI